MRRTAALLVALLAATAAAKDRGGAKKAVAKLRETAARPDSDAFKALFPRDDRVGAGEAAARRRDLAKVLVEGRLVDVREQRDRAVLVLKASGVVHEVPLHREDKGWRFAYGRSYVVASRGLDALRGGKPARVRLTMRTTNGPYGTSAFSFAYVTGKAQLCKNRMDIWFCHNRDFHASGDGRIAALGDVSLKKVQGIPVDVSWHRFVAVHEGQTYVIHCRDRRDRDFFVKFRVRSLKRDIVELEWTLLSDGDGAPINIKEPQPLLTNDGADGADGLCGRNG